MNLFSYGDAAGNIAAFENQRSESGLCQIESSYQTIVSATDDDDAPRFACHQRFHDVSIVFAAFSPGAPMMPPPGCVADPHI